MFDLGLIIFKVPILIIHQLSEDKGSSQKAEECIKECYLLQNTVVRHCTVNAA